jgi:thymidine kinase
MPSEAVSGGALGRYNAAMAPPNNPTFAVFKGPMFSSKTTRLLYEVERLKYQARPYIAFKPAVDIRYDAVQITSHLGAKLPALTVHRGEDILEAFGRHVDHSGPCNYVVVDELFMIPNSSESLIWLFQHGVSVMVSTLDLSYSGKPFREVERVLPWATRVETCSAVCVVCGDDAHYTYRKNNDDVEIVVGGSELYEPRCMLHHPMIGHT